MKLHRHIVQEAILVLEIIFLDSKYADKVIEKTFKNHPKWGGRDRRFFAETIYDIVRNYRLLCFCAEIESPQKTSDFWKIFGAYWFLQTKELPNFSECESLDKKQILAKIDSAKENVAIKESYPDWLAKKMESELGDRWKKIVHVLNQKAPVVLRVNRLKSDILSLQNKLSQEDVATQLRQDNYPDALVLSERKNVFITKSFKEGLFEVQDGSSQLVAPFLKVEPGLRVMDACAGAGGKTLHIASLMGNKGKIISMDIEEYKLLELKKRLKRAGVDNVEARLIDSSKVIKRNKEAFDRVLLDVPCTGLGVIKRNPDTKWKLSAERLSELLIIQKEILREYSQMTKKGGYLVYATCSILPSENEKQVDEFLKLNKDFIFEEDKKIYPDETEFDGFYMCRMKRV